MPRKIPVYNIVTFFTLKSKLAACILFPLSTLLIDKFQLYGSTKRGLGFPFDFVYFIGYDIPKHWYQFFLPENIVRIQVRLDLLAFNIIAVYFLINIVHAILSKGASQRIDNTIS